MTGSFTLLGKNGQQLGEVRYASREEFIIYNISDVFRAVGVKPAYATHVKNKRRAGKYLFATWMDIKSYFRDMRSPSYEVLEMLDRTDPRVAPVPVKIQFKKSPVSTFLQGLKDEDQLLVLENLHLYLTDQNLFRYTVGETLYRQLRAVSLTDILEFPAVYAMELQAECKARIEKNNPPAPPVHNPISWLVNDGKLVIQIEVPKMAVGK